jgi:hypothetical protein
VADVLKQYVNSWDVPLQKLKDNGLLGQALSGFHQVLLGRDLMLPRITPDKKFSWLTDDPNSGSEHHNDKAVVSAGILQPPSLLAVDQQGGPLKDSKPLALQGLAPPHTKSPVPFGLLHGGHFTVDALWIVDDFGQWLDLLGGSSEGHSTDIVVSPHSHWAGDPKRIAQPPRVLQPARLNFRFIDGDFQGESGGHPDSDPVCGWVFHNYLDQALALCDADGNLLGELVLVEEVAGMSVRWECLKAGEPRDAALDRVIEDVTLRAFAQALIDSKPQPQQKLQALLALIDDSLGTIRPATTNHRVRLAGRPLALVNARIGLELFGKAWADPLSDSRPDQSGSGDPALDALRLPVQLGYASLVEDGLIGYYKQTWNDAGMASIVAVRQPKDYVDTSGYLGDAALDKGAVCVGFGGSYATTSSDDLLQGLTLLMDPHGAVHASAAILPAKSLTLPKVYLDRARDNMELSFRVAPLLLRVPPPVKDGEKPNGTAQVAASVNTLPSGQPAIKLPIHLPVGWQGRWGFEGHVDSTSTPRDVIPPDGQPDYGPSLPLAVEGRLVLRKEKNNVVKKD